MEVLEDDDERSLLGHRLEESPPGRERRAAAVVTELRLRREADQRPQLRLDPVRVAGISQDVVDRVSELLLDGGTASPARRCPPEP